MTPRTTPGTKSTRSLESVAPPSPADLTRQPPARLRFRDVVHLGAAGLRGRPTRVVLSALGIAVGIGAMIAVVGISTSAEAELTRQLDRLGTNLLVASPADSAFSGQDNRLPRDSVAMIARIEGVEHVGATGTVDRTARRTDRIPSYETGGIEVLAATPDLLTALRASIGTGSWLNPATGQYPAAVLGDVAARRLGITAPGQQVFLDDRYVTVIGILNPLPLAPEIERSVLLGWDGAQRLFGFDGHPTTVYERSTDASVTDVRALIPRTANPRNPQLVQVSDPSTALQTRAAALGSFDRLLIGIGAVALFVGGIGIANTMIITVLERRYEIGLRRSLGATRGQIRVQFVTESTMLAALGGLAGIALGALVTLAYTSSAGLPFVVPLWAGAGGFGTTLLIGTLAGLYPAVRAARLPPTLALHA